MISHLQDDQQRLICPTCGLAFTDQRQHDSWHVDQRMKRLQPVPDFMASLLTDALNKLPAATVQAWEREEDAALARLGRREGVR